MPFFDFLEEKMNLKEPLFTKIDCLRLYVPDLEKGINFYHKQLGLPIGWRTETAIGFLMGDGVGELVIQNEDKRDETDLKVESVIDAVELIKKSGGVVVLEPFDIKIGKCAVVKDPFDNKMVILDSTKGTFITDENGKLLGQRTKK